MIAACLLLSLLQSPLEILGARADKDAVGNGERLAAFAGGKVHWSTFELGPVFSPLRGRVVRWDPHVLTLASADGKGPTVRIVALPGDVLAADLELDNAADTDREETLVVEGSLREAHDFRQKPQQAGKRTEVGPERGRAVLFEPGIGLWLAAGMDGAAALGEKGGYRLELRVPVPRGGTKTVRCAIAMAPDRKSALERLERALELPSIVAASRDAWARFFEHDVPSFACSDQKLVELWLLRWWLLRFSTSGAGGSFTHPVVLEGRSAYQTYCCYSAPFLAIDLRWARDPAWGEGHHLAMAALQHDDGRFPWYSTVTTTAVPVHHSSQTGHSFLAATAWMQHLVHGRRDFLVRARPFLAKNALWWERVRDPESTGLHRIDHLLETGMDDAPRAVQAPGSPWRPIAGPDLASYRFMDLEALELMSREAGDEPAARSWRVAADRVAAAVRGTLWDPGTAWFCDVAHGDPAARSRVKTTAGFYPFFAGIATKEHLPALVHLLSEKEFWLPFPVPSVAADEAAFDPGSYWKGPTWPATSCHVVAALARAAKELDPGLEHKARELFDRCVAVFFTPRPDFYERYDPLTGKPLSTFKDYMHSWWIDLIVQHVVGLTPLPDGKLRVHPLRPAPEWFELRGVRMRGHDVDVVWRAGTYRLTVDGKTVIEEKALPRAVIRL